MAMPHAMSDQAFDLLPLWVTLLWVVLLSVVLVFHCGHLIRMGGQNRWFHSAHIVMMLGMLDMYVSMEFGWQWLSAATWMWVYAAVTGAILAWLLARFAPRRPLSALWILVLVQQAAMIYMWAPPAAYWVPWITYGLAAYFAIEAAAWLSGLLNHTTRFGREPAIGPGDRSAVAVLHHSSRLGDLSMAVMPASMGYMFVAMQLMV